MMVLPLACHKYYGLTVGHDSQVNLYLLLLLLFAVSILEIKPITSSIVLSD